MDDTKEYKHPSYGMVQFSRVSGGKRRLFGSTMSEHANTIYLRIAKGTREFHLKEDRYYAGRTADMIEVEMSASQFSELITTMNIGSGVPCTIRRFNGERVEGPPDEGTEMDRVREDFAEDLKNISSKLDGAKSELGTILAKKSIGKGDKKAIAKIVSQMFQHFEANVPFVQEQFQRATDRSVAAAKTEIDATLTCAVTKLGLQSLNQLKQLSDAGTTPALPSGDDE